LTKQQKEKGTEPQFSFIRLMFKDTSERRAAELQFIEKIALWLDHKYELGNTKFKFGIDPIIGLIPFLGHAITFVISGTLALLMLRHGASGKVAVKMVINIVLDTVIGAIPILGNVFDFVWKANLKNVRLLKEHYDEGKHIGSGWDIVIKVLVAFVVLLIAIIALFIWAISELIALL
jgi:hypothetical protein